MPEYLYRFRSIEKLLNEPYQEIESQEIYFSPPDELNDPLEGFKDIFWRGDHIVWRNLLRHYLLNLMQATSLAAILGKEFKPETLSSLVHQTDEDLPQAPIREIYASVCREFFDHSAPKHLITALSSQPKAVRRDELIFYLRLIQPLATSRVFKAFGDHGHVPFQSMEPLDAIIESMNDALEKVLGVYPLPNEMSDSLYAISENLHSQLALIHEINNPIVDERQSWMFINRDFPSFYVNALEQLIFPNWHVACLAANPTNASMWGTYGDGHKGACLKFKTRANNQGTPTLDLYRISSWSGGINEVIPHYSYVPHGFIEVGYKAEFPEIDFFESLGTISLAKLNGFWFVEQNGERSTTASRMLQEDEPWREEYWRKFAASYSNKSPEWAHEEEHRLLLYSNLERFDDLESRKLKYRFADLAGIVFGIKTTTADKLAIMRIIDRKCISEGRKDFEFYQAHYSNRTKKIEIAPLSLIKMK
jgi:Protein of unknown function (DUF2971)